MLQVLSKLGSTKYVACGSGRIRLRWAQIDSDCREVWALLGRMNSVSD